MAHRVVFTVVAWICLTCVGVAQTLTFPLLTGRVVDEAGLLSPVDIAGLDRSLADLEARTTDQLVVVTLKSLRGTTIEDYGYQLGRRWKIGQKDKDSGVLMIVVPSQQRVRFEVGYGLEGTLTDAATRLIIENSILPRFKNGNFSGGIRSGVADIVQMLVGDAARPRPGPAQMGGNRGDANTAVWPGIALGLLGVALLTFCAVTGGGGACRAIMQILFVMALSGRGGGSSRGKSNFSGGGGSFGGGGSSGSW